MERSLELHDTTRATLALSEADAGHFRVNAIVTVAGVYRIRVVASGVTMRGILFTREHLLSATAILGGDNPPPTGGSSTTGHDQDLCKLMGCLLCPGSFGSFLKQNKADPKAALSCVETQCEARLAGPTKEELVEREGML